MKRNIAVLLVTAVLSWAMTPALANEKAKKPSKPEKKPVETTKGVFTDPNKAIQVAQKSPQFSLTLRSNPTTGYSWFLVGYDHNLITPISRRFKPDTSKVGAPGKDIWTFKVKQQAFVVPQATQITLQYFRPWVVPTNGRKLTFLVVIHEVMPKKKSQK